MPLSCARVETSAAVPWREPALGAVAVFRQTQEGKGTHGSSLFTDEHGVRIQDASMARAPSRCPTPLQSSKEMKLAVKACPGKGGLVRKEVRKGKRGISRQSLVEERVVEIALSSQLGCSQQVSVLEQNNEVTHSATLCFSFWFGVFLSLKKKN